MDNSLPLGLPVGQPREQGLPQGIPRGAAAAPDETGESFLGRIGADVGEFLGAVKPPRRTSFSNVAVEPFTQAITGPTFFQNPLGQIPERALYLAGAPFEVFGRTIEAAAENAPRLVGADPVSSPESRLAGLAGSLGVGAGAATGLLRKGATTAAGLLPEIPALGKATNAIANMPGVRDVTKLYSASLSPLLSRMAHLAPEGVELARLEQVKSAEELFFMRDHIMPLYRQLRKLSKSEKANFVDALQGQTPPLNSKVQGLLGEFDNVFGTQGVVVREAQGLGLAVTPRQNFFMHEFSPDKISKIARDPAERNAIVQHLVKTGQVRDAQEGLYVVDNLFQRPRVILKDRLSAVELPREYDIPGWLTDPAQAVLRRGERVAKRFAEVKTYGHSDHIARDLLQNVADPVARQKLTKAFDLTVSSNALDDDLGKLVKAGLTVQAITKLPLAFAANLTQPALGLIRTNMGNLVRGLTKSVIHPLSTMDEANKFGMSVDMATRRVLGELAGGNPAANALTRGALGPYNVSERVVRYVAYNMADDWSKVIGQRLNNVQHASQRQTGALSRELQRLNFSPVERARLLQTKVLTPKDVERIKWSIADQLIFFPRGARRSAFYTEYPAGRIVLQFKNFLGNAGRLFHDNIIKEAKAGNPGPLLRMIHVLPTLSVIGEGAIDLRSALSGSRRQPVTSLGGLIHRTVENLSGIGALGIAMEVFNTLASGRRASSFVLGPTGGDVDELFLRTSGLLGADSSEEFGRQSYEAGRSVARRIPLVGPAIHNLVMPSSTKKPLFQDETLEDRLGLSDRVKQREEIRLRRRDRRRRSLYQDTFGE